MTTQICVSIYLEKKNIVGHEVGKQQTKRKFGLSRTKMGSVDFLHANREYAEVPKRFSTHVSDTTKVVMNGSILLDFE